MKKLNATKAIAILSLGLMFSVVVAGCGGGNDTNELKVKNSTIISSKCRKLDKSSAMYKALNCEIYGK